MLTFFRFSSILGAKRTLISGLLLSVDAFDADGQKQPTYPAVRTGKATGSVNGNSPETRCGIVCSEIRKGADLIGSSSKGFYL
jgi:hypothetical protein